LPARTHAATAGERLVTLTAQCDEADYAAVEAQLDNVLATFKFVKK
jgi:hypothetical protein